MEQTEKRPQKLSPLSRALAYLVVIFLAQLAIAWIVGKIFPAIPCGSFADQSCQPHATTERLILDVLLPLVFIPFAIIQLKQIVMYAGALPLVKKLSIILISAAIFIVMVWQLLAAIGVLLGQWFG